MTFIPLDAITASNAVTGVQGPELDAVFNT